MKRNKILIIIIIILIIFFSWLSFWFYISKNKEKQFLNWFNSSTNIEKIQFKNLNTTGFPNRIDLKFENINIFLREPKIEIFIKFFQIFNVIYQKNHSIISFQPELVVRFNDNKLFFNTKKFLTSIKKNTNDKENIITSEIEELNLNINNKKNIFFKKLLISKKLNNNNYDKPINFFIKSENIIFSKQIIKNINNLSISGKLINKKIKIIDLENFLLGLETFKIDCNGILQIEGNKIIGGKLNFKINNWQDIVSFLKKNNLLEKEKLKLIENGFLMLEIFQKNKSINFEVLIDKRFIYIGSVKIDNNYDFKDLF